MFSSVTYCITVRTTAHYRDTVTDRFYVLYQDRLLTSRKYRVVAKVLVEWSMSTVPSTVTVLTNDEISVCLVLFLRIPPGLSKMAKTDQ